VWLHTLVHTLAPPVTRHLHDPARGTRIILLLAWCVLHLDLAAGTSDPPGCVNWAMVEAALRREGLVHYDGCLHLVATISCIQ
jgi:hypothetical protein